MQQLIRQIRNDHTRFEEMYKDYLQGGGIISDDLFRALESHLINMLYSQIGKAQTYGLLGINECADWILKNFYELGYERDELFIGKDVTGNTLTDLIDRINREIEKHNGSVLRDEQMQERMHQDAENEKEMTGAQLERAKAYPPKEQEIISAKKKFVEIDIDM